MIAFPPNSAIIDITASESLSNGFVVVSTTQASAKSAPFGVNLVASSFIKKDLVVVQFPIRFLWCGSPWRYRAPGMPIWEPLAARARPMAGPRRTGTTPDWANRVPATGDEQVRGC